MVSCLLDYVSVDVYWMRVDVLDSLTRYLELMIIWVTSCHLCDPSMSVTGVSFCVEECQSECMFEGRFSV